MCRTASSARVSRLSVSYNYVFIEPSKAFDTDDHQILLKKLEHDGANERTLAWLESCLFLKRQYIEIIVASNIDLKK